MPHEEIEEAEKLIREAMAGADIAHRATLAILIKNFGAIMCMELGKLLHIFLLVSSLSFSRSVLIGIR